MNGFQRDKDESDKYIRHLKAIAGQFVLDESSLEEDQRQNTDLVVLRAREVLIACRVRSAITVDQPWRDDFTIRCERPRSGNETELDKIKRGWGSHLIYGIASKDSPLLLALWSVVDLNRFRRWFLREESKPEPHPWLKKSCQDGSANFLAFPCLRVPPELFVPGHRLRYSKGQSA